MADSHIAQYLSAFVGSQLALLVGVLIDNNFLVGKGLFIADRRFVEYD